MSNSDGDQRNELAEQRTETAFHRTLLAEQRTYSAWVRTGLASAATGFAIAKLMKELEPTWVVQTLSVLFILAGAAMFPLAFRAYRDALSELKEVPSGGIPLWTLAVLSLVLFFAAILGLYTVF